MNYSLVTVGRKYRDYDEPFELIEKLGIKNRVKHLSFVTKEVLLHLYNAATVFVFPSLYEGFGIPVLEAMACRTPVIVSNVSSLPEVAGNSAFLIDPYDVDSITDAIDRVLNSSSLQNRMRESGLKRVKEFSWSKAATETVKVYRKAYNKEEK
ncbi:D-inositol 3-phosphate glycosyltransferase [subsurface metagenome]